jgi:hypothetical protein
VKVGTRSEDPFEFRRVEQRAAVAEDREEAICLAAAVGVEMKM